MKWPAAALAALPVAVLVHAPLAASGVRWSALDWAQGRAVLVTLVWAAAVAAASTMLAAGAALALWTQGRRLAHAALLAAPLPAYLHALAWLPWLRTSWLDPRGAGPWLAAGWVMTLACLPLAFAIVWTRLRRLDGRLVDAALLHEDMPRALARVVAPLWRPALGGAASLVFLLSVTEFTVPSLFAADPWTLEIFTEFSATQDAAVAAGLSLPLLLGALPALAVLLMWARTPAPAQGEPPAGFVPSGWMMAAAGVLALGCALPVASLVRQAAGTPLASLGPGPWRDAWTSFSTAAVAAGGGALLAAPLAWHLARTGALWPWLLALAPLAAPAPLAGAGLITLWNRDAVPGLYGSPAMLVLAAWARFLPVAVLAMAVAWKRVDPRLISAAHLHGGMARALARVTVPLLAPGALAAAALVFLLSLSELGATLLVAPPGGGTLSIRLYNYLHYGAAGPVAWLALLLAAGAAAAGWPLAARFVPRRRM